MRWIWLLLVLLPLRASDLLFGSRAPSDVVVGESESAISEAATEHILSDGDKLVPKEFHIPSYFLPYVRFWFGIYTRYSSDQIVLHDKSDLDIVYGVLDFTETGGPGVNPFARAAILQRLSSEKIEEIKNELRRMARGDFTQHRAITLLKIFQDSGSPPPKDPVARRRYFEDKAAGIRGQTGQRNLIEAGLEQARPLQGFMLSFAKDMEMPKELFAIPFLESSFNNRAESKVGALGVWQFMPLISSYFVPKRSALLDYRQNPIISSVAALHLLRQNYSILKRWDLSVTAYNSGTKHLVEARRRLGIDRPELEQIFRNHQSAQIGFASKNFYSEFLALVYTLAYQKSIFPRAQDGVDSEDQPLALAKCSFVPRKLMDELEGESERWAELNPHLYKLNATYPRGTIVVATAGLPSARFWRVPRKVRARKKPLEWQKELGTQSCSTR